jgi:hypothetical protein
MKAILTNADHRTMANLPKKSEHSTHLGDTTITILLAVAFLGFVMMLSYLFISQTMGK